jgi:hypothetical protein
MAGTRVFASVPASCLQSASSWRLYSLSCMAPPLALLDLHRWAMKRMYSVLFGFESHFPGTDDRKKEPQTQQGSNDVTGETKHIGDRKGLHTKEINLEDEYFAGGV